MMKILLVALLAGAAATPGAAAIVQSVRYAVGPSGTGSGAGTFSAYAGPVGDLAGVTFDLTVLYANTDSLFTFPGSPGASGTASGTAGVATSNGVSASTPFTPVRFSCAAGAASCGASLSTLLRFDAPLTSLAAFVGTGSLSLFSQGAFVMSYDSPPAVRSSAGSAQISGTVTYTLLSDLPEPASWAMMIGGFGMVGGALRRRHRSLPEAA